MSHTETILLLAGFLLLCLSSLMVDLWAKRAAKTAEPYLSPLDGTREQVPPPTRVGQFLLWALSAGVLAMGNTISGQYLVSSVWYLDVLVALYIAWVYRRGREPKVMEGF